MDVKLAAGKQEWQKRILLVLIVLGIGLFSEEMLFSNTVYQKGLWVLLALAGIVALIRQYEKGTVADQLVLLSTPMPLVLIMLYTVIRYMITGDPMGVARQAFSTTMFVVVDVLMVVALMSMYKKRSIDVLFAAIVISYSATMIHALSSVGLSGVVEYIADSDANYRYFERHDIGIAVVPLILYYLSGWLLLQDKRPARGLAKAAVLTVIMLLCGKRSAYLGLAAGVAMLVLFLVCRKHLVATCRWVMAACVVLPFLYVCFIRFGGLSFVARLFNINSMGRVEVYEWFSDQHTISPLYIGKGFQYIHRYMLAGMGSKLVNDFEYLHNSILQLYIEGGFWGFFLWFAHAAVGVPVMLHKWFSRKVSVFYLVTIVATITIFLVDNALTYPVYQVCLYAVLAAVMTESTCKLQLFRKKRVQEGEDGAVAEQDTNNSIVDKLFHKARLVLGNIWMAIRSLFWKRRRDTVLFGAWFGDKFADNSRFLYQYLAENKKALGLKHVVWVTRNETVCETLRAMGYEVYMMDSAASVRYHKTAFMHVICNSASNKNGTIPDIDIRYSFGAKRVNLWHGVGVVKGVGCASKEYQRRKENNKLVYAIKEGLERIKLYRQFVTGTGGWGDFYFLSPTETDTMQFAQFSYVPRKNFIQSQYPRTCPCVRLTPREQEVLQYLQRYDKVVMYLPTFRTGSNKFDFSNIAQQLEDTLERENILWVQKAHSASSTTLSLQNQGHILNLEPDFDINVLMPHCTLLVTDYSSAASDARFFRKPVVFYVPDLEEYTNGDNGVTPEAEELMRGPQVFDIDDLRRSIVKAVRDPESAKPEDYEQIRFKYWGEEKDYQQIWSEICDAVGK